MCTLIVLHRCVPDRPLVVAANRDEFLGRPAEGPALRSSRTGPIVAPLDLEAGGTWVGVSARGVFAGLTNLRPASEPAERTQPTGKTLAAQGADASGLRSRGEVVMRALEANSASDAIQALSNLEENAYNPFQLLVADGDQAWLIVYRGEPRVIELEPGPHVVGNVEDDRIAALLGTAVEDADTEEGTAQDGAFPGFEGFEGLLGSPQPGTHKLTRIRERVEKLMADSDRDLFEGLARICREHVEFESGKRSPFDSTCVHVADRYGTRSSLLLELSRDASANRLWTTDGPPCERSFENRSSLIEALGVRLGGRMNGDRNDARRIR